MTQCEKIARFALTTKFEQLDPSIVNQLKIHLLDTLGSILHASTRPTIIKLIDALKFLGDGGECNTRFAGTLHLPQMAQLYTALLRYPDFMDNFLAKEATCHPSDNVGALLAAAQLINASGKDFLTAVAVSYCIECKLCEEFPVMMKGFDHTVLLGLSMTAGLSKLIGLTHEQTAHALAITGCSNNPTVTCRASYTYEWKGLASSQVASNCAQIVWFAKNNLTGPITLFEGPKGYNSIYDLELKTEWQPNDFELIKRCCLKTYNAEVHTQSALEATVSLRDEHAVNPANIKRVLIETFLTTYHIVGGGEYGDRKTVHSKEQADHSLPYLAAVALLDGKVTPEQLLPERINKDDVQSLLQKVDVTTAFPIHEPKKIVGMIDPYTRAYPDHVPVEVTIELNDGKKIHCKKDTFKGFFHNPFTWADAIEKFKHMIDGVISPDIGGTLVENVKHLQEGDNMRQFILFLSNNQEV